jgi:ribonucleoside-triphosphate reductase
MSALHEQPVHGVGNVFAQDLKIGDSCDFYRDGKIEQLKIVRIERGIIGETLCLETENDEHTFVLANGLITSNCRLQLDKTLLRKRGGGLFGSDAQTGSIGVVTINLARLGYLFKGDLKGLYKRLDHLMDLAKSTLEKKRVFVKEMNARGLYPYTRRYLKTYDTYFSTIGVNGGNEMIRNFTNDEYDITDPRGQKMAMDLLTHIRERLLKYQDETGNLYNLEATPGEGTCYRFAREDQKQFGDAIIQAGVPEAPYYTNSTQLPVYYTNDVFTALDLQDDLQKSYTGGTVLHIYTDEEISAEECKTLIKKVISNYRLPYVSFTATFSTCPKHGRIPGVHEYCPLCDKELMEQHIKEIDLNKD